MLRKEHNKLLISFSGGRTSAYMTYWLLNHWNRRHEFEKIVVYANTGKEEPETLEFVEKCDKHFEFNLVWVEAKINAEMGVGTDFHITDYHKAERKGKPFENMIAKYGIPNQAFPHCTRELKTVPIQKYARSIFGDEYATAIGIRKDESHRINWERYNGNDIYWPLVVDHPCIKSDINYFWSKQPFDLEIESFEGNCDLCWKKSNRKHFTIIGRHPEKAEWWNNMEEKYSHFRPEGRSQESTPPPYYFFRGNQSMKELIEESKLPFEPAIDESKMIDKYKQMRMWDEYMDKNDGCVESCEVF